MIYQINNVCKYRFIICGAGKNRGYNISARHRMGTIGVKYPESGDLEDPGCTRLVIHFIEI
jgi:hypothetical protein